MIDDAYLENLELKAKLEASKKEADELRDIVKALAESTPENIVVAHAEGKVLMAFNKQNFVGMPPDLAKAVASQLMQHAFDVEGAKPQIIIPKLTS